MTEGDNVHRGLNPHTLKIGLHALDMLVHRGPYATYDEASQAILPLLPQLESVKRVPGLWLYNTPDFKRRKGVRDTNFYQLPGSPMVYVVENLGETQYLRTVLLPRRNQ